MKEKRADVVFRAAPTGVKASGVLFSFLLFLK